MKNIPQVEYLKTMLALHEKRAAVQENLDAIDTKLSQLQAQLGTGGSSRAVVAKAPAAVVAAPKAARKITPRGRKKGSGRGELKAKIFAALKQAGNAGVKVQPLASALGTKAANIYAWFHAAVKRYPEIKKLDGAHYRLDGGNAASTVKVKAPKAARAPKAKAPAKAPKAAKPGRKPKGKAGKAGRGELKGRILDAVKASGASGISVKDLADKLGVKYKNVQVWFATTGKKKDLGIKKIGPALYRLA